MTEFVSPIGSPIQDLVFHLPPEQRKQQYQVLLLEGIDQLAVDRLKDEGYMVESLKATLDPLELKEKIKTVHAIGIRSRTMLTEDILLEARNLLCIGTFCIGTNQVDLKAAERLGIPVFNSPFSNSRSVAELTIGQIIALSRRLGEKNLEMHKGTWNKSAKGCYEIRGKTLGIVGYGHIGSQLSVLAESMGMNVIYYDINPVMPLGNSTAMSHLDDLLKKADFVTLHVPETPLTKNMITKQQLRLMRKGSYLLNASRGTVVNIPDLAESLKAGHLGGAYIDVFPTEPAGNSDGWINPLEGCQNVILTPHIGGSTVEAQAAIGDEVAAKMINYINAGKTMGAVNFPEINLPYGGPKTHRILNIHRNKPGVLKEINNILSVYNVESQILRTMETIGYFIADVDQNASDEIKSQIDMLPSTIKTRILY